MTSGARYPGVPITRPVFVSLVASGTCAMPKSMITGWSPSSMTLPGLRSRCTTPAAWMAVSASASPSARLSSATPRSGPSWRTVSSSVRPGTYLVTMYGEGPSTSASTTSATNRFLTRRMVSTSRARRCLAFGSPATAAPSTLTATRRLSVSGAKVDNAHAALADLLDQAVRADLARERIQCLHRPLRVRPDFPV